MAASSLCCALQADLSLSHRSLPQHLDLLSGRIVSCSTDKSIKIWNLDLDPEQECEITLEGHKVLDPAGSY